MEPSRHPVVLVPGAVGQDLLYWNVLQPRLERAGFPVATVTFPRFSFGDHRESARILADRVDDVLDRTGAPRVHLVGHSMGGLVARWYIKNAGGEGLVDRLVCLGTPHHGTVLAYAGMVFKGARMVRPGSSFLQELNAGEPAAGVPILNVASRTDTIVLPWRNAVLEGENVVNRVVALGHHWGLLVSGRVIQWVREALEASEGPLYPSDAFASATSASSVA